MPLSTSPSDSRWPRRAAGLLGVAALAFALAVVYTLRWNPEVRFYRHAVDVKRAWSQALAATNAAPRFLLAGGSSAAFSVDGERLLARHRLKLVNFGLHAGMEAPFLIAIAAEAARPGDTIVVAMEPELLTSPFTSPDLAAQLALNLGEPRLIHASDLTGARVRWVEDIVGLRPGAYHAFTLLGKIALRKPLYRYTADEVRASGWQEARDFREFPWVEVGATRLSSDGRALLSALGRWSATRGIRVLYSLPWSCVAADRVTEFQRVSAAYLSEVAEFLPVLRDPALGAHPVREHYADTGWHLATAGAQARTDSLAEQLKAGQCWTREELAGRAGERAR